MELLPRVSLQGPLLGEEPHLVLQAPAGFLGPLSDPPIPAVYTESCSDRTWQNLHKMFLTALAQVCKPERMCSFPQAGASPHTAPHPDLPVSLPQRDPSFASASMSGKLRWNGRSYPSKGVTLILVPVKGPRKPHLSETISLLQPDQLPRRVKFPNSVS